MMICFKYVAKTLWYILYLNIESCMEGKDIHEFNT